MFPAVLRTSFLLTFPGASSQHIVLEFFGLVSDELLANVLLEDVARMIWDHFFGAGAPTPSHEKP